MRPIDLLVKAKVKYTEDLRILRLLYFLYLESNKLNSHLRGINYT